MQLPVGCKHCRPPGPLLHLTTMMTMQSFSGGLHLTGDGFGQPSGKSCSPMPRKSTGTLWCLRQSENFDHGQAFGTGCSIHGRSLYSHAPRSVMLCSLFDACPFKQMAKLRKTMRKLRKRDGSCDCRCCGKARCTGLAARPGDLPAAGAVDLRIEVGFYNLDISRSVLLKAVWLWPYINCRAACGGFPRLGRLGTRCSVVAVVLLGFLVSRLYSCCVEPSRLVGVDRNTGPFSKLKASTILMLCLPQPESTYIGFPTHAL